MKVQTRALVIACSVAALLISGGSFAQPFKWTDENGRTVYSDTPPDPSKIKKVTRVDTSAAGTGAPVSVADRLKKSDDAKKSAAESAKKGEESAKAADAKAERCTAAKADVVTFESGGRIYTSNAKGERTFMTDEQIAEGKKKAEAIVAEACKS
jgi:hypothetical protein